MRRFAGPTLRTGIGADDDIDRSRSPQQPVNVRQFGGDVDLLRAGRQAIAAADAGRAVARQGGVLLPRPVEIEVIPRVPLVPEDVRDRNVLGAGGDALGAQEAGQAPVVAGQETEGRPVLRDHGHGDGRPRILAELVEVPGRDHRRREILIRPQPLNHRRAGCATRVLRVRQELSELLIVGRPPHAAHRLHGDGRDVFPLRHFDPFLDLLAIAVRVEELGRIEGLMLRQVVQDLPGHVAADAVVVVLRDGQVLDQPLLLEALECPHHARVLLRLGHRVVAEVELEDVVVTGARLLQPVLDELVVPLLVDLAALMVAVHAVDDAFEVIRLPGHPLEGGRKRVGGPPLGLVPVIDPGGHGHGNELLRPVGGAHEPADLEAGAAVPPLRQLLPGGLLVRPCRQSGEAGRGHSRRPKPHHVPAREVVRTLRHGRAPFSKGSDSGCDVVPSTASV